MQPIIQISKVTHTYYALPKRYVMKKITTIIQDIVAQLDTQAATQEHLHTIAWWMLETVTQEKKLQLIIQQTYTLSQKQEQQLQEWIIQHTKHNYPLQYLLGSVPFGPLEILTEPPTLIPRPETETWVALLLHTLATFKDTPLTILDMCTGSGCIGLWLAHALPQAHIYAVDIADTALTLAKKNAQHNAITNITFLKSDLFMLLNKDTSYDLIISNPPYITPNAWHTLSDTVKNWEDKTALVAQQNGMELIKKIIYQAPLYIKKTSPLHKEGIPQLVLEIGYDQGEKTAITMQEAGYSLTKIVQDAAEIDRVVCGWL